MRIRIGACRTDVEVARLLPLTVSVAIAILAPASADARRDAAHTGDLAGVAHGQTDAAAAGGSQAGTAPNDGSCRAFVDARQSVLARCAPCGTPHIAVSPHQLPDSVVQATTGPEPAGSVVEMWTEMQDCTITINASVWASRHEDDESFQWFCDSMTHEVGHLFGHLDGDRRSVLDHISVPRWDEPQLQLGAAVPKRDASVRLAEDPQRNGRRVLKSARACPGGMEEPPGVARATQRRAPKPRRAEGSSARARCRERAAGLGRPLARQRVAGARGVRTHQACRRGCVHACGRTRFPRPTRGRSRRLNCPVGASTGHPPPVA